MYSESRVHQDDPDPERILLTFLHVCSVSALRWLDC